MRKLQQEGLCMSTGSKHNQRLEHLQKLYKQTTGVNERKLLLLRINYIEAAKEKSEKNGGAGQMGIPQKFDVLM